jgi:hypothetical protein
LIDFDTYQPKGHTMQDFAHLEAEIKFALMECETADHLPALDLTDGRLPMWCRAEKHLLNLLMCDDGSTAFRPNGKGNDTVRRAVDLIQNVIRVEARKVHKARHCTTRQPQSFAVEYGAALLYFTLRTIGYPRVSGFKRLLAVYSAARLIELLDPIAAT